MNVYLLGATGSIGTQTIEVIEARGDRLVAFSAGHNMTETRRILAKYDVELVSVQDKEDAEMIKREFPNLTVKYGGEGLLAVATLHGEDGVLVNALVGSVGVKPTEHAILAGKKILLANKETLVVAGDMIMALARRRGVEIIPIDSEHSAIMQAIGTNREFVRSVTITASGGALRNIPFDELKNVTKEDALKHPNWEMGAKITIDSATMMNKGFEVIEAHHLFDLDYEQIETVIHKESIIHSFVTMVDGAVLAQMGHPDMKLPIEVAMNWPDRFVTDRDEQITSFGTLSFDVMDLERYPLLDIAYQVGKAGGVLPCVLNAANEAAVSLFLKDKISYTELVQIVIDTVTTYINKEPKSIDELIEIDAFIKETILSSF